MKPVMYALFAMTMFLSADVHAQNTVQSCQIYLSKTCVYAGPAFNRATPPGAYFTDSYGEAHKDVGVCLARAAEYKAWCRTAGLEAWADFRVNGKTVISAGTYSDGKVYIYNKNYSYINFHN